MEGAHVLKCEVNVTDLTTFTTRQDHYNRLALASLQRSDSACACAVDRALPKHAHGVDTRSPWRPIDTSFIQIDDDTLTVAERTKQARTCGV